MAQTNINKQAVAGTEEKTTTTSESGCPTWDKLGAGTDLLPFFRPNEEMKRDGFEVTFLCDAPRRETESDLTGAKELWFDVDHEGKVQTWTVSQLSLLIELKKHVPLTGKSFAIKLVPVDADFRQKRPKYKGKDRYEVRLVPASSSSKAKHGSTQCLAKVEEELVGDD